MPIMLVKMRDNNVPDSPGKWLAGEVVTVVPDDHVFADAEQPGVSFYHVTVTDKTLQEVRDYLQNWAHDCTIEQLQFDGTTRRIRVTSSMVSATGRNAFERAPVEALIERWSGTYVTHTQNSFTFDADIPAEDREAFELDVEQMVRSTRYKRRRWYINAAGMAYLAANGGTVSGTAAQVAGYLKDGFLE